MTDENKREGDGLQSKKRKKNAGGHGRTIGLAITAVLFIIAVLVIYPRLATDEAPTEMGYGDTAVDEASRRMIEEAFKLEDQIERNAYHHWGKLKDEVIFRQAGWWATIEEIEQAEDRSSDTAKARQYLPEHLAELQMELPTILGYIWSVGETSASIEYQFGRKTKKLSGIVISTSLPPNATQSDINGFLLKTGLISEAAMGKPDREVAPRDFGFSYRQWNQEKMRLALAWKEITVTDKPRHTRVMIYSSPPGYGGETYPLNYLHAAFNTYTAAVQSASQP